MVTPLDPKQITTTQELALCNMLEIEILGQLLFEKGVIIEEEFIDKFKERNMEMKEKWGR